MQSAVLSVMKVLLAGSFRGGEDEMANMKTVLKAVGVPANEVVATENAVNGYLLAISDALFASDAPRANAALINSLRNITRQEVRHNG